MIRRFIFIVAALTFLAGSTWAAAPEKFPAGDGRFEFTAWSGPALPVFFHAPATITPLVAACAKSDDEYLKRAGEFLAAH